MWASMSAKLPSRSQATARGTIPAVAPGSKHRGRSMSSSPRATRRIASARRSRPCAGVPGRADRRGRRRLRRRDRGGRRARPAPRSCARSPRGKGGAATRRPSAVLRGARSRRRDAALRRGPRRLGGAALAALADAVASGDADLAVAVFARSVGGGFGVAVGFAHWAIAQPDRARPAARRSPASGRCAASVLAAAAAVRPRLRHGDRHDVDAVRAGCPVDEIELDLEHRATGRTLRRLRPPRPPAGRLHARLRCAPARHALRIGSRLDDPRDRPGHHRHHLHRLRRGRRIAGARLPRVHAALPAPGLGRARRRTRSGRSTRAVAGEALADAGVAARRCAAIGITNQRETVVAWDRATGEPLHRAIVWQDRRTADRCERAEGARATRSSSASGPGLVIDPYFSGTKIEWLLRNVDGLRAAAASATRCFGTIDSWLAFKLTGRAVTDYSNASRTHAVRHRRAALGRASCARCSACRRRRCRRRCRRRDAFGETEPDAFFGARVPLAGIAGDQQAALFGQACHSDRGSARTPTGPAASCSLNAGPRRAATSRRPAHDRRLGARADAPTTRSRRASS